jgi:hypothetical protein
MSDKDRKEVLIRVDADLLDWLHAERDASGRSLAWLLNHAARLWQRRLERERARAAGKRKGRR